MVRRIYVPGLKIGLNRLPPGESHHLKSVLRLGAGEAVELFDDQGNVGRGLLAMDGEAMAAQVEHIQPAAATTELVVASAVPKGERADWMIEKLSELGVTTFIPLATRRSVVLPEGRNKRSRWQRLATESAQQCRRAGVMNIAELTPLPQAIRQISRGYYLSPDPAARPLSQLAAHGAITLFIGPEGGWTDDEIQLFAAAAVEAARLTATILRTETAAIAAAAIVASNRAATT